MLHFGRRSLLAQLLSVYLLFVIIVLAGGAGVNAMVEQRLQNDVQASDQALAQEIGLKVSQVAVSLTPENVSSAAVQALNSGPPIQKLLVPDQPLLSYDEGFRLVLAIPTISRYAGSVVLLVHRSEPHPFDQNEVDLLLPFAKEQVVEIKRADRRLTIHLRFLSKMQALRMKTIERLQLPDATLSLYIPNDWPLVAVDTARIEVVFHNLVTNAQTYGEGEVRISAEERNDMIVVSVADNGPGIVADELPYVFERFYRAQHGRQQYLGGTGLGLTICKAFIEAHGGSIWVESSIQGAIFSFSLPRAMPVLPATPAIIMKLAIQKPLEEV